MKFDLEEFKKEYEYGDLNGLNYIEKTIIKSMEQEKKTDTGIKYTRNDYIISLFHATMELNNVNNIYEQCDFKNDFKSSLYFNTKLLLFKELGIEVE